MSRPRPQSAPHDPVRLGRDVVQGCLSLGFAAAGIAPAAPTAWRERVIDWLAAGNHGTMSWLTEHLDERLDVTRLVPGARAVIVVADQYAASTAAEPSPPTGEATGVIAKYARGRDYHRVVRRRLHALADRLRRLHPGEEFRSFVDSGPVLEREHAARAGMGWIGRHTLLIHPRLGSYLLLGGIATTLDVAPEPDAAPTADHCGTCTRCIDACPTAAIAPGRAVDARRCISYLTIEHDGPIDPALHPLMGDHLLGCDVCQDVCPHNAPHPAAPSAEPRVHPAYTGALADSRGRLPLLEVLGWTADDGRARLTSSAAKRASLEMLRRNAVIAAGNALRLRDDPALRTRLADLASGAEDATVRDTARAVLAGLAGASTPRPPSPPASRPPVP